MTVTPDASREITTLRCAVDAAIRGRRSVRAYRPDPIPEAELAEILDAARWAPSPHNAEPWRFTVVRGQDTRRRLAAAMGSRWAEDLARDGVAPEVIERELRESYRRITEAPTVIVVSLASDGLDTYPDARRQQAELLMATQSLGAAVQNIMLAAYVRGIATGWMCAPLFCPEIVVATLGLPPELTPQGLITMGYPRSWPPVRKRRPMRDLVVDVP